MIYRGIPARLTRGRKIIAEATRAEGSRYRFSLIAA